MEPVEKGRWAVDALGNTGQWGSHAPSLSPCRASTRPAYMDACIESHAGYRRGAGRHRDPHRRRRLDEGRHRRRRPTQWAAAAPRRRHGRSRSPTAGTAQAVNTGLRERARGCYFKVVDSDDWLDEAAMAARSWHTCARSVNGPADATRPRDRQLRVREGAREGSRTVMHYRNVFPEGRELRLGRAVGTSARASTCSCTRSSTAPSFCATWAYELPEAHASTWTTSSCTCRCRTCSTLYYLRRGHVPLLHRPRGPER